jgi:nuclear GTP-binding protein
VCIPIIFFVLLTNELLTSTQMNTDDPNTNFTPRGSRKRSRSPSPAPANEISPENAMTSLPATPPSYARQPKRQRKSKDVPAYDALPEAHVLKGMGRSNPLNRRVLKREAKRARRAGRVRGKTGGEGEGGGGMEIDDEGLGFTFIA